MAKIVSLKSLPLATGTVNHPGPGHCGGAQAEEPWALPAGPAEMARILLSLTWPQPHW